MGGAAAEFAGHFGTNAEVGDGPAQFFTCLYTGTRCRVARHTARLYRMVWHASSPFLVPRETRLWKRRKRNGCSGSLTCATEGARTGWPENAAQNNRWHTGGCMDYASQVGTNTLTSLTSRDEKGGRRTKNISYGWLSRNNLVSRDWSADRKQRARPIWPISRSYPCVQRRESERRANPSRLRDASLSLRPTDGPSPAWY